MRNNRSLYHSYLMHYGIKGQKWGVRRYQNADGTLTAAGKRRNAKEINQELRKQIKQTGDTRSAVSDAARQTSKVVGKNISKKQLEKFKAADDRHSDACTKLDYELKKVEKQRRKIADKLYSDELKANPSLYTSERDKQKLRDYCYYDEAESIVRKNNPQLRKAQREVDAAWNERQEVCKQITNELIGNYGKRHHITSRGIFTTEDFTQMAISDLARYNN